jgi:hypothetical protein
MDGDVRIRSEIAAYLRDCDFDVIEQMARKANKSFQSGS